MKKLAKRMKAFWRNEDGIGTLEVILIVAVVIIIALLFKDWIVNLVNEVLDSADEDARKIFES
ncbi:multidrug transporter [Paenibacillus nanensis]|uniref:Multidrug transporter n=1 Tax=Paenibacillus nanensis TaxID=393251 RepID=A0A3A1UX33_9BACL|nr:Flp1 family type IVb pilin [Paenibacillus nanensis]RIX52755.1 multidrug transporter [Paenibacillus nanensis]